LLRGDHELNALKAEKLDEIAKPLRMTSSETIRKASGAEPGTIGPSGLNLKIIADHATLLMTDFTCGANVKDCHLQNVNWERDLPIPKSADLRNAVHGDPCPTDHSKTIIVRRGIEVGHVFQLGNKYSKSQNASVLNKNGKASFLYMGCYGIGITRIVAAAIEQHHDENGIVWPDPITPFDVCIIPIGLGGSAEVSNTADELHDQLTNTGFEVILDDRSERPGVMFAEMDLIGIPHQLIISARGLKQGTVEYRNRRTGDSMDVPIIDLVETLRTMTTL